MLFISLFHFHLTGKKKKKNPKEYLKFSQMKYVLFKEHRKEMKVFLFKKSE